MAANKNDVSSSLPRSRIAVFAVTAMVSTTIGAVSIWSSGINHPSTLQRLQPVPAPMANVQAVLNYAVDVLQLYNPGASVASQPTSQPTTNVSSTLPMTVSTQGLDWAWLDLTSDSDEQASSVIVSKIAGTAQDTALDAELAGLLQIVNEEKDLMTRLNALDRRAHRLRDLKRYEEAATDLSRAISLAEQPTTRDLVSVNLALVQLQGGHSREGLATLAPIVADSSEATDDLLLQTQCVATGLVIHYFLSQHAPGTAASTIPAMNFPEDKAVHLCDILARRAADRLQQHPDSAAAGLCVGMARLWHLAISSRSPDVAPAKLEQETLDYVANVPLGRFTWRAHALVQMFLYNIRHPVTIAAASQPATQPNATPETGSVPNEAMTNTKPVNHEVKQ